MAMMEFPNLSDADRIARLQPPAGRVRMVLDTDAYNEIDDQFAVVHALLSPQSMSVEALYAAPFHNDRSTGPADGMEKSHEEILRLLERLGISPAGLVHRGARGYLARPDAPQENEASRDLVRRAMTATPAEPLYVAAVGAITNVASAILMEPRIIERIVVVWLGGNALHCSTAREFNLQQDPHASRLIFDCGVPLVHVACHLVTTHLHTTVAEIDRYVRGRGAIGDYLADIFAAYSEDHFGWSKVIWDIAATAWLVDASWLPSTLVHSPILTENLTWSFDTARPLIRSVHFVHRDGIFRDLFTKLQRRADAAG